MKNMSITVLILIMVMTVTSYADYFAAGTAQEYSSFFAWSTETTTAFPPRESEGADISIEAENPYGVPGGTYKERSAVYVSDGEGFTSGDDWNGTHDTTISHQWYTELELNTPTPFSRSQEGVWIRFQLARTEANPDRTVQVLDKIKIWNFNHSNPLATSMGMKDVQISAFNIGTNTWTDLGTYTIPKGTGNTTTDYGYVIDVPNIACPHYIQITCLDNWDPGVDELGYGRVGLAEVRFEGTLIDAWCEAPDQPEDFLGLNTEGTPGSPITLVQGQAGIALNGVMHGTDATGVTWTKLSGPGTVLFADDTDPATTATFSAAGSYVLELTETASGYTDQVVIRIGDESEYSGLIGYWPLNGDATDVSGNGNNGVASGGPSYTDGVVGSGIEFDGVDDGVVIPNPGFFDRVTKISPELTVTFWAKTDYGVQPHGSAISKILWDTANVRGAGWSIFGLAEKYGGDDLMAYMGRRWGSLDYKYALTGAVDDGEWHHYAFRIGWETDKGVFRRFARMYVDGAPEGGIHSFNTSDYGIGNGEPLAFGYAPSFETGYRWKGQLDEVRFFDRALTAAEITALYAADGGGCTPVVGDVNKDCDVDMNDFAQLAAHWLDCTNYYPGDCFN